MLDGGAMPLSEALAKHSITDAAVAEALGVSLEAVRLWRNGQRRLSAERAVELEERLGVPRQQTRPDLWPAPDSQSAAA